MNRLPFRRTLSLAALILLLAVAIGCGRPHWRSEYAGADFDRQALLQGTLALGGVVLSDLVDAAGCLDAAADPAAFTHLAQSDRFAPLLGAALREVAPDLQLRDWGPVSSQVRPEALQRVFERFARGGVLTAADLEPLAADLPGQHYLLLGRIERNSLELRSGTQPDGRWDGDRPAASGLGKQDDRTSADAFGSSGFRLRREVVLTLEVYDLRTGASVWAAAAQGRRDAVASSQEDVHYGAVRLPGEAPAADGPRGPAVDEVLLAAARAAARDLLGEPGQAAPADDRP